MINRMDNICEAVMKGKWPFNRRQFFDFPGLLPGYGSMTTDSPLQRRSLGDLSMVGQTSYSGSEDLTMSPQVNKASPAFNPSYCTLRLTMGPNALFVFHLTLVIIIKNILSYVD